MVTSPLSRPVDDRIIEVRKKGIEDNSLQCTSCIKWIHVCSGVKGMVVVDGEEYNIVDSFSYMLSKEGGANAAVTMRSAWKKPSFRAQH